MKLKGMGVEDEETHKTMIKDIVELYDKLSGKDTTDLKTFGIAVFVAFKD